MWSHRNPHWWWDTDGVATLEGGLVVSYKAKHVIHQSLPLVFTKGDRNLRPLKTLHVEVYGSSVHNCPSLEAIQMPSSRLLDR